MELFEHAYQRNSGGTQPLAARMRPRTLDEFVGQDHILGKGRLLRRAIQADQISSLLFYGPPGTGKTTLASIIAAVTQSHFEILNAVWAGVKDLRKITNEAHERAIQFGQRTILFVDEVHRWNKAQQDGLLPWVENGTIILIGATTENPYFSVNRPLVSRSRVFQLRALNDDDLRKVLRMALGDETRGYGTCLVRMMPEAEEHLVNVANGDARALLNALELAVETTDRDAAGRIVLSLAVVEESIQKRAVLYDKEGDYHFDTISAFIKALRGSDPDAALYWMAKMVYAGEDPQFILRRMLVFASEDVGLADSQALNVALNAAQTFDRVGMPEGQYALAHAALYLATAEKSNSTLGYFDALKAVESEKDAEVPNHLKDASRDKEGFGHGKGYKYPHAYSEHWVAQQYLPSWLQGRVFYQPGEQGVEGEIGDRHRRRREIQLAALFDDVSMIEEGGESLTRAPENKREEEWLQRASGTVCQGLEALQQALLGEGADWRRHDLVLLIGDESGLLLWEALRRVPEGGVYVLVSKTESLKRLEHYAGQLEQLRRPVIFCAEEYSDWPSFIDQSLEGFRFDHVIGRDLLRWEAQFALSLDTLQSIMAKDAELILAENAARFGQRLYRFVADYLDSVLLERLREIEETSFAQSKKPEHSWSEADFTSWLEEYGLKVKYSSVQCLQQEVLISKDRVQRWFAREGNDLGRNYLAWLRQAFEASEIAEIQQVFEQALSGRRVEWKKGMMLIKAITGP